MKPTVSSLVLAATALALTAADQPIRRLSVFDTRPIARLVPVPGEPAALNWMLDHWSCVDRALRTPPANEDNFPHLQTMDLRSDRGYVDAPSAYGDGCRILARCTFLDRNKGAVRSGGTNLCDFNFSAAARGLAFGHPLQADFLQLRRDTNEPPRWFILEHQDTGDVLLFERTGTNTTRRPPDSAPASGTTGGPPR